MFALIESHRTAVAPDAWPARASSFMAHALLAAGAVWATQRAPLPTVTPLTPRSIVWAVPSAPPAPRAAAPVHAVVPDAPVLARVPVPTPVATAPIVAVPDPGVPPVVTGYPGVTAIPGAPITGDPVPSGLPGGEPRDVRYVEELPVLLAHPPLRYPELLRRAGIRGAALIEAIIDTTGRVEPRSTRVLQADHRLFGEEAAALVAGSRYRAARVSGQAVRVRIQVPVVFALGR